MLQTGIEQPDIALPGHQAAPEGGARSRGGGEQDMKIGDVRRF